MNEKKITSFIEGVALMSAECVDDGIVLSYGDGGGAKSSSQVAAARADVVLHVGEESDSGPEQHVEDEAVAAELRRLVLSRLPDDGSVRVLLCDNPEAEGISREALAAAIEEAYGKAGIGERAEGINHFAKLFRGYEQHEHGPVRFVVIEDASRQIWVFCDYFDVYDDYTRLGEPYAPAAAQWKQRTELQPGEHVMSKLVNAHNLITDQRGARIAAGLGARVFASIVQGLANANEQGMLLAGNAQAGTRNFVLRRLGSLLTGGLEVVFDNVDEGREGEAAQAQMVIHVRPAVIKE